ncbi:hypothetical protein JF544_16295 [Halobacillus kuroshimensis]|uniref:DUF3238 domain-containing protein n=1 Tax=Halobacillus kuroshimensis TaxID=302481 RepID=A0ABS3DZP2_9BACI|nr:hypothetical protein [Halobacillus kuroshimensis]MBN8236820.1 hypothetical protein [Halobacillus kuroshimensis]
MKRFLVSSVASLALIGGGAQVINAESTDVDLDVGSNQIELDWEDTGENYKVYLKDEIVWEGSDSHFTHENLKSNHPHNYNIEIYENGELEQDLEVRTKTLKNTTLRVQSHNKAPNQSDAFIDAVVNDEGVELTLRGYVKDEYNGKMDLYKNGELIKKNTKGHYIDKEVSAGEQIVYKFVSRTKVSNEKVKSVKEKLKDQGVNELSEKQKKHLLYQPNEYIKLVKVPVEESRNAKSLVENAEKSTSLASNKVSSLSSWSPPAPPAQNQTGFKYRTYIPMRFAKARSLIEGYTEGYQFGGDNRTYNSFSGGTHRTQTDVNITFHSSYSTVHFDKDVTDSTLYDENGNYLDSSPAPSDISYDKGVQSGSTNYIRLKHAAAVGFATAEWATPDINYDIGISTYSDGGFGVSGTRDQAPNHELWWYVPYGEWDPVLLMSGEHQTFYHLTPALPSANISISY